jgi:hypothetical protein
MGKPDLVLPDLRLHPGRAEGLDHQVPGPGLGGGPRDVGAVGEGLGEGLDPGRVGAGGGGGLGGPLLGGTGGAVSDEPLGADRGGEDQPSDSEGPVKREKN